MRCFIGLPLPPSYQEQLAGLREAWRKRIGVRASFVAPGNLHLTLKFLGEITEPQAQACLAALQRISFAPFAFQAASAGVFPRSGAPRVLWAGAGQGERESVELAAAVESACQGAGFAPESRPFSAHLTLARFKPHGGGFEPSRTGTLAEGLALVRGLVWPVGVMDRCVLWQSLLRPEGSRYIPLGERAAAK